MRLDHTTLARLPAKIQRPPYAIAAAAIGVVHIGPGAFHRAHQAWVFDDALAQDPRWGISAISLKSAALHDALAPQQGLYTVAVLDAVVRFRVIGALRETLVASAQREQVFARLSAQQTRIVTLTITEKGYCLDADGRLDFDNEDVRQDLAAPRTPTSAIGYLVEALRRRRDAGLKPFSVISCDNLVDNGGKLRAALIAFATALDPALPRWIEDEVAFPRTMVDSIVPATDSALLQRVQTALGLEDRWPVQREAFLQWIIEKKFCNEVPDWSAIGVTLTDDVASYERAKLRLLNGAHSTLAYLGLNKGYETVGQAMADAALAGFVERMMRDDIAPSLIAPRDLDLQRYIDSVLARLGNPAMRHALAQIAWDGSQKLPFRLLGTIREALANARPIARLCLPIAAWFVFLRRARREGRALSDPMSDVLLATAQGCNGRAANDVPRFLALSKIFGEDLAQAPLFVNALTRRYDELARAPVSEVMRRLCARRADESA